MGALLLEKRRLDNTEGVLEAKGEAKFEELFAFAPMAVEEWVKLSPDNFDDDSEEERALLGYGSFGSTYRVRTTAFPGVRAGTLFAAKVVEVKKLADLGGREAVLREAEALGELRHHHVVRFLRLFQEKKRLWLVMELAGGGSLAQRLPPKAKEGPALSNVWRWARQIADAMVYIHGRKIFHRDIKPENVLLSERGRAPLFFRVSVCVCVCVCVFVAEG